MMFMNKGKRRGPSAPFHHKGSEGNRESRGGKEGDTTKRARSRSDGKDVLGCKSSYEYCEVERSGVRRQPSCADDECRSFTNSVIQACCLPRYSCLYWPWLLLRCWPRQPLRAFSFIAS